MSWGRPDYDLDDPTAAERVLTRDRPDVVIHAAAWTDVDGCARDPELAMRRNGTATAELALACARNGIRLMLVSTNEVFDGERTDGAGYREGEPTNPINPYGFSKLEGENSARAAFRAAGAENALVIARTAWLFGPPGADFPQKIVAAADRLPEADALPVVDDEVGSPTYTLDLAPALLALLASGASGVFHMVNAGRASRLDVARRVLGHCRPERSTQAISRTQFSRPSTPPAWGVLDSSLAVSAGAGMRPWQDAIDEYSRSLCPAIGSTAPR